MNDNVSNISQVATINGATFAELLDLTQRGTATILNKIHGKSGWSAEHHELTLEEAKDYLNEKSQGYVQAGATYRREARRWLLKKYFITGGKVKKITDYEKAEFEKVSGVKLYNGRSEPSKTELPDYVKRLEKENKELKVLWKLSKKY